MAVYLHYVGERWYSKDEQFINEGKEMGVQRLTSFNMVKKLFKEKAIIYYARYDRRGYARVFAIGKVIGIASTMHKFRNIVKEGGLYNFENRGCGTCYTYTISLDNKEIERLLDKIDDKEARRYRWFILTDIEHYNASIDNVIEYKVKEKKMIVKDILFTRGFIKIRGGGNNKVKYGKGMLKVIRMHKLKGSKNTDDIRYTVDTTKYKTLDTWLGGIEQ
jgi:hypothetical protein